ncbi:MAG: Lrp/AsnC family transcriptional regulator [Oscillospiraceae bacterium]|nr:Lrp/AsnC family transcriptional regulator [Oscillospiraceae bacterium]
MDEIDQKILHILSKDARATGSDIARRVGLAPSPVIKRIQRFEERGIITHYTAAVDYNTLGYGIRAFLHVQLEHAKHGGDVAATLQQLPGLLSCDALTGEFDFLLQAVTRSTQALDELHRAIGNIEGVAAVKTHVVLRKMDCTPLEL